MAVLAKDIKPRWVREFERMSTFDDDLGALGAWVGPRTGPAKRDQGQREDYVLRRFLVALKQSGRLRFRFAIAATRDEPRQPDFTLVWPNDETLGIEVTEATSPEWQRELTKREEGRDKAPLSSRDISTLDVARQIAERILEKANKFAEGFYRDTDECVLLVYDNTEYGGYLDKREILRLLKEAVVTPIGFSAVHLVAAERVWFDILGEQVLVDISKSYEIDFANWIADQVERLRLGGGEGLDLPNIAEELEALGRRDRRALKSHLRNLILHLLKWENQPQRRGESWVRSINNARSEIEFIIADSPSLKGYLDEQVEAEYERARSEAVKETGLGSNSFPEQCPYSLDQLFDEDFLPKGNH